MKKLTVCILTYRRADFLKIAIERILQQSFADFDLIIVDDCSPDHTAEVVQAFHDPRITYIRNERNLGFNANYNKALSLAKSPYVLLTHDDDEMTPTFLEREVAVLDAHPEVAMVATNTESIDPNGSRLAEREIAITEDVLYQPGEYIDACFNEGTVLRCPTYMFRRSFLDSTGIAFRDVGPGSDIIICLESNLNHVIYLVADPIFRFRAHAGQDHLQLRSYLRANFQKELNIWRIFKNEPRFRHHLADSRYRISYEFPVHLMADLLDTGDGAPDPDSAITKILATLHNDELPLVACSSKFELLRLYFPEAMEQVPAAPTIPTTPHPNIRSLLNHNDRLLRSWCSSPYPITKLLADRNITEIALWGVGTITLALASACKQAGIAISSLIDNDVRKTGSRFIELPIEKYSSTRIPESTQAIITCIESWHDLSIRQQIEDHPPHHPVQVYSWKDLALYQSPQASLIS